MLDGVVRDPAELTNLNSVKIGAKTKLRISLTAQPQSDQRVGYFVIRILSVNGRGGQRNYMSGSLCMLCGCGSQPESPTATGRLRYIPSEAGNH